MANNGSEDSKVSLVDLTKAFYKAVFRTNQPHQKKRKCIKKTNTVHTTGGFLVQALCL